MSSWKKNANGYRYQWLRVLPVRMVEVFSRALAPQAAHVPANSSMLLNDTEPRMLPLRYRRASSRRCWKPNFIVWLLQPNGAILVPIAFTSYVVVMRPCGMLVADPSAA